MKSFTHMIVDRADQRTRAGRAGRVDAESTDGNGRATMKGFRMRWYTYTGSTAIAHKAFVFGVSSHGFGDGELA